MNVLVINCGSSSLKYQLIDSESEAVLAKGLCERIGIDGRLVYQKAGLDKEITEADMPTHKQAIQMVLDALVNPKTGAIASLSEIDAVGHRVVHGGEKFASSTVLTPEVLKTIEECNDLSTITQPGKPDRYQCMQRVNARRTDGRRIRYCIPSDHAEKSISVRTSI